MNPFRRRCGVRAVQVCLASFEKLEGRSLFASAVGTVSYSTIGTNAYAAGDVNVCAIATSNLVTDVASNKQFVAYYDASGSVIVGRRTVGAAAWQTFNSGISVPTDDMADDHNVIAIAIDSAGYMHTSWNMHNVSLNYAISTTPVTGGTLSSLAFTKQTAANAPSLFPSAGATTNSVTYPQFYTIPNSKNLLFTYRNGGAGGGSGNGNQFFDVYSPTTKKWTNKLVINGEKTNVNAYLNSLAYDSRNNLQMTWTWRDTPNWQTNSNIMFAQSPDNGTTWYRQGGTTKYTLPIVQGGTPATSVGQVVKTIPQGSSFINQTSMAVDANDNPMVATFLTPQAGNPNRQYVLVYYSGGQWKTSQISNRTSDTAIDNSAAHVRDLGRPVVLVDKQGRVLVVTRSQDTAMGGYKNPATADNHITVYYSSNLSAAKPTWSSVELDAANMGAWEATYDAALWKSQNKLSLVYEPVGLSGQTTSTVKTLDWDAQAFFANPPAAQPAKDGGFESPTLVASPGYQYNPAGTAWAFAGNAGVERDGSAFNATPSPQGVQAAFLQSNVTAGQKALGRISQSVTLPAGIVSVSFKAAQRAGKPTQPIAFMLDGVQIGATITPTSTGWATYTLPDFAVGTAGKHTIAFAATDATLDRTTFLDDVRIKSVAYPAAATNLAAAAVSSSQIKLTWKDNATNETGYAIERSANGSSGWTEVSRGATANQTAYTVTGLAANTTYFFRVRTWAAANTTVANGGYSAVVSAKTLGIASAVTYQAEAGTVGGGAWVEKTNAGYAGTGYVNFNTTGGSVSWSNVAAASAGTRTLTFRYALSAASARTVQLTVNGATVSGGVKFSPTGGWTKWATVSVVVGLKTGNNVIRLTATGQDGGNLDTMTVS